MLETKLRPEYGAILIYFWDMIKGLKKELEWCGESEERTVGKLGVVRTDSDKDKTKNGAPPSR